MAHESKFPDDRIDALVRAYLQEQSQRVDVPANLAAIERRLAPSPGQVELVPPRRSFFRRRWPLSVAASVLIAACGAYLMFSTGHKSAYAVVSAAHDVMTPGADRCYRVRIDAPEKWLDHHPFLRRCRDMVVWTRGDRFRATDVQRDHPLAWGQDENRRVWFASGDRALTFEPREVPTNIAAARAILNLDVSRLSNRFLEHFDLEYEPTAQEAGPEMIVIRATLKPGHPKMQLNFGRMIVEPHTNVIRKLELARKVDGQTQQSIIFTLVGTDAQPDTSYRLASHVPADATILNGQQAEAREQLLHELVEY